MAGKRKSDTARTVVGRVMAILGCFSRTEQSMGLVEISRRTGLPVSTVFRLVGELREAGAVERMDDLRYRVGPRLVELAELRDDCGSMSECARRPLANAGIVGVGSRRRSPACRLRSDL
jgi:DNA-binding IclR family transcriptional regulator